VPGNIKTVRKNSRMPDIEKIVNTAIDLFGDLPDPDVYPKQFRYFLKLAEFQLRINHE